MSTRIVEKKNYTVLILDEPVQVDFTLEITQRENEEGDNVYSAVVTQWSLYKSHRFLLLLFRELLACTGDRMPDAITDTVVAAILEDVNDCLDVWY